VKHIVHQQNGGLVNVKIDFCGANLGGDGLLGVVNIVSVKGDIQRPAGNFLAEKFTQTLAKPLGKNFSAAANPDNY